MKRLISFLKGIIIFSGLGGSCYEIFSHTGDEQTGNLTVETFPREQFFSKKIEKTLTSIDWYSQTGISGKQGEIIRRYFIPYQVIGSSQTWKPFPKLANTSMGWFLSGAVSAWNPSCHHFPNFWNTEAGVFGSYSPINEINFQIACSNIFKNFNDFSKNYNFYSPYVFFNLNCHRLLNLKIIQPAIIRSNEETRPKFSWVQVRFFFKNLLAAAFQMITHSGAPNAPFSHIMPKIPPRHFSHWFFDVDFDGEKRLWTRINGMIGSEIFLKTWGKIDWGFYITFPELSSLQMQNYWIQSLLKRSYFETENVGLKISTFLKQSVFGFKFKFECFKRSSSPRVRGLLFDFEQKRIESVVPVPAPLKHSIFKLLPEEELSQLSREDKIKYPDIVSLEKNLCEIFEKFHGMAAYSGETHYVLKKEERLDFLKTEGTCFLINTKNQPSPQLLEISEIAEFLGHSFIYIDTQELLENFFSEKLKKFQDNEFLMRRELGSDDLMASFEKYFFSMELSPGLFFKYLVKNLYEKTRPLGLCNSEIFKYSVIYLDKMDETLFFNVSSNPQLRKIFSNEELKNFQLNWVKTLQKQIIQLSERQISCEAFSEQAQFHPVVAERLPKQFKISRPLFEKASRSDEFSKQLQKSLIFFGGNFYSLCPCEAYFLELTPGQIPTHTIKVFFDRHSDNCAMPELIGRMGFYAVAR